jgi:hypothetical protein
LDLADGWQSSIGSKSLELGRKGASAAVGHRSDCFYFKESFHHEGKPVSTSSSSIERDHEVSAAIAPATPQNTGAAQIPKTDRVRRERLDGHSV